MIHLHARRHAVTDKLVFRVWSDFAGDYLTSELDRSALVAWLLEYKGLQQWIKDAATAATTGAWQTPEPKGKPRRVPSGGGDYDDV